jgi:site-specific DNA recombinase
MPKTQRAVLYSRVSRDRNGETQSVDAQVAELRTLAQREGWRVVAEHRDDGIGASQFSRGNREEWHQVIELIENRKVDLLVCRSLARASRDRMVFAKLFSACERNGVGLSVGGRYMDPAQPEDAFGLDVEAAFAVRAAATMSKDIRKGQLYAAEQGRPHGPSTWPFRRVYNAKGALDHVELIEDRAKALRVAAKEVLAGGTLTAAAKKINALGLDEGRDFAGRTLRRLLMTPTLAGLRVHQGKVVAEGCWPAVFDLDTHRKLNDLLSEPDRRRTRDNIVKHLLPGVALCGRCGARVHRIGGTSRAARLVCSASPHVSHQQASAEDYVERVIVARLQRPDVLDAWQPKPEAEPEDGETIDDLAKQLAAWEDAAVEGKLSPEAFGRIEARITDKIAELEEKVKPVEVPEVLVKVTTGDVPANWQALPMTQKRDVVRLLGAPKILPGRGPVHERVVFPWEKRKATA